jgi:hypothetical protein
MLRRQSFFLESICRVYRPPAVRATTRRILTGIMAAFFLGTAGASAGSAQEQQRSEATQRQERPVQAERQDGQEPAADWAMDNLDLVSTSPPRSGKCSPRIPA